MKCPNCDIQLHHTQYEKYPVFQCPKCAGYLVAKKRLSVIKGSRERSTVELETEAQQERQPDQQERLRCPKCLANKMSKEKILFDEHPEESFTIDVCRQCSVIWFDGGELARLQLDYEASLKAIDELEFQQQWEDKTEVEKEQVQEQFAALPADRSGLGISDGITNGLILASYLLAPGLYFLERPPWMSSLASVFSVLASIWLVLYKFDVGRVVRILVSSVLVIAVILWNCFLFQVF